MGIAAIANDYLTRPLGSAAGKETTPVISETESFGQKLQAETEKKCPYSFLAKDGVIQYKGVTFVCDYKQNAITLGNMYEKDKVLKIALPSGGSLHVNVDNIDTLSKAASMFTPEDLNAIMRAIHEYNHCTRKRMEIEEQKAETAEEAAAESETPDAEKEPEEDKATLAEQINAFRTELFYKLINNETEIKIQIGSQEMSIKEWDKLMNSIDKELETIHEALLEKEEKQSEKEQEERIRKLFEDRNANEEIRDGFGRRNINEIRFSDVKQFYVSLLSAGLQVNTLDNIHTVLHPTFQLAVRDNVIRSNPSDGVMAELKKNDGKNKGIRHALTLEQQRSFLNYTANSPVYSHWLPLFTFLFGTGCRIGEAVGIRWEDVDFEKKEISVNHSLEYISDENRKAAWHVSTPKTAAGVRVIPLLREVEEALLEEKENQKRTGVNNVDEVDSMTGFMFANRFGKLLLPSSVNRAIVRISDAYNAEETVRAAREKREPILIPHFSAHHIRHTFATRLCEHESNQKVIQSIMGHADIATTMNIYAEATKNRNVQTAEIINNSDSFF